jgi:oligosaccharyltransferase complex subunit alpha (ribophorin I)
LDTIGRPTLVIKARNLVDDFRDRELILSYDLPLMASLRKPLIVFGSSMALLVSALVMGKLDFRFDSKK